jgi:hypothetical protein
MPSAERLLRLYPRAWRDRYGDELIAIAADQGGLNVAQSIDVVFAAIDAWLSMDVRQATRAASAGPSNGGGTTMLKAILCERNKPRVTITDGLIGAGVMIASTVIFLGLTSVARNAGWTETGKALAGLSFPVSFVVSMPFWLMKGQPWKAQAAIIGTTLVILAASGILSAI